MNKLYSYVLRFDDGAAPNPFWDICTLTICKPVIRRNAQIGDWIIGTGSKNTRLADGKLYDYSDKLVYAMKVTQKMTIAEYDKFCKVQLKNKIPNWKNTDWRLRVGDCIYDYSNNVNPAIRKGVHNELNLDKDLSGINALLSNYFYFFGEKAYTLPDNLKEIIKRNQGHKKIEKSELIMDFEAWISNFELNKVYGDPQMRWYFDKEISEADLSACAKNHKDQDEDENEEVIC